MPVLIASKCNDVALMRVICCDRIYQQTGLPKGADSRKPLEDSDNAIEMEVWRKNKT